MPRLGEEKEWKRLKAKHPPALTRISKKLEPRSKRGRKKLGQAVKKRLTKRRGGKKRRRRRR